MAGFIDSQTLDAFRLTGLGWVFAFFIVATCFLTGSWLIKWQLRRIERIADGSKKAQELDTPGARTSGSATSEPPRD